MGAPTADVVITGVNQADVHWPETFFESRAMAEPGTCQITLRGTSGAGLGEVVRLYVNGENVWTGYILSITQTTWFPDKNDAKTVIQGADLNILLDKLIVYNHEDLAIHPTGKGKYKGKKGTGDAVGTPDGAVPPSETVAAYLEAMLKDTDIGLVDPPITPDISGVTEPFNPTGAWGLCANAGTTLRGLLADAAAVVHTAQQGSIIWYISPEGRLIFHDRDIEGSGVATAQRNLTRTTDVSNVRLEAFVFAGSLDPSLESKQVYLKVAHEGGGTVGSLVSQYAEQVPYWSSDYIDARANKIVTQQSEPAKLARWQQYSGGLKPGQIVSVEGMTVPVRSIRYTFPNYDAVILDVEASYDTLDPWGLILAARRPPNRGQTPPQVVVLPMPNPGEETRPNPPAVEPYTKVEESPLLTGMTEGMDNSGTFQLTYGYIKGSVEVFAASSSAAQALGLDKVPRWEGLPTNPDTAPGQAPPDFDDDDAQPLNMSIGYRESDPGGGKVEIMLPAGYFTVTETANPDYNPNLPGHLQPMFPTWNQPTIEVGTLKENVVLIVNYFVANILGDSGEGGA